jgi:hypothetical protein
MLNISPSNCLRAIARGGPARVKKAVATGPSSRPTAVTEPHYAALHNKGGFMKLAEAFGSVLVTIGLFSGVLSIMAAGMPA